MRTMYDATSANAGVLVAKNPDMVAIYLTGTPDIRWTAVQVAFFPRAEFVRIDQGGFTSPQFGATVVDVEPGAWTVQQAETVFLPNCTAERPTIYCDRNDYQNVTAKCDIWLAAPGLSLAECEALAAKDPRIVAIQNVFAGSFDSSVVFDDNWPNKAPVIPRPVPSDPDFFQMERYQPGFGWVLETIPGLTISDNSVMTNSGSKYRVRVNHNSVWSDWTEVQP